MLDGETLGWEGVLSFSLRRDGEQLAQVTKYRHSLTEDQSKYIPPRRVGETVRGAVAWKPDEPDNVMSDTEVTVTPTSEDLSTPEGVAESDSQDSHSEQTPFASEQSRVELEQVPVGEVPEELSKEDKILNQVQYEDDELGLGDALDVVNRPSVVEEVQGDSSLLAGEVQGTAQMLPEWVTDRCQLVEDTLTDVTLKAARKLTDTSSEGCIWEDGLLFKCQLEPGGSEVKRLCLPASVIDRYMTLAHDQFGHRGYTKVAEDLSRVFYWPSLWRDARAYNKECETCQRFSKSKPRKTPMCKREVVTIPHERVCVHLVGPLPKAKGGVEFILTCIDVATRWLEAVALRKMTAQIVVTHLTEIFSKNGFPGVLVSDNGPQFTSKVFASFCSKNEIHHIKTAVYSPESTLRQMTS